ncbi:hypothetical protein HPB49_003826 [Dermacentor silvarum]|uniref:Uncharacterized protein n=1 Tax=Dermacentor silvarum TaxID=543639 RepID=A0ACB8DU67_DERSI|nr:hypothetical protein HPB49_003826 [Dermacentor silvarum]
MTRKSSTAVDGTKDADRKTQQQTQAKVDVCEMEPDPGPCNAIIPAYYFNATHGCIYFIYGGCYGNGNNFDSVEECMDKCELTEEELRQYFRLSKRTVRRLCDELDSIIGCQRASGLSTERKVLCPLRFFGTGSFRRSVGREEQIGMAQPAASNTIQEVTEAIISVSARRKLVDFSLTPAAKDEAKEAFARRGAIPGVLACVDGTLIAVMKPEGLSPADTASFMSRKGYYALNVIVVCNSELCILVVDLRLPDSGHDSWMWQHNPLCTRLAAQLQPGESLLGKCS